MNNNTFKIIVIDDNPAIHNDFIKILQLHAEDNKLDDLKQKIFSDSKIQPSKLDNETDFRAAMPLFEIDTATQGQEGVEKIRLALENGQPYALAFVDIRMPPGWDGIETIQHIWKIDHDIQVVICTAYSDYSWEETIQKLGMVDNLLIIKKPFDNVSVRQLAAALTKKWRLLQERRSYMEQLEKKFEENEYSLQQSMSEMRATLESSADGILVVGKDGIVTDYNAKFSSMWNLPKDVMSDKNYKKIMYYMVKNLGEPNKLLSDVRNLEDKPDQVRSAQIALNNGQIFEYYTQPNIMDKEIVGRVWSFRDVTESVYLARKLEYQATHDTLTNLPNRTLLIDRIKYAIQSADKDNTSFAVLFLDLDNFKMVNDSLGYEAGNILLKEVAARIQNEIKEIDTIARLGGDEFVIIIQHMESEDKLANIINKLLTGMSQTFDISNHQITITACIGISLYPKDGTNPEELLRNADLAMYLAKREGRNKFQLYEKKLNEKTLYRFERQIEIKKALANNEFFLQYQPQINIHNNKLVGVEALLRWNHPLQGVLLPADFIDIAEETGFIIPIGQWIFKSACKQNKAWQLAGLSKIRIAVNVTGAQLNDPHLIESVKDALNESGLEPQYLEIELKEDVVINNDTVENVINELTELGVRVSFDDFGTGNSTLHYLRKVPINQLKIDQSFVKNINNGDKSDEVIIQAIISMANSLKLDVVAEGVETQEQLDFLNKNQCNEVQGFLYSKPLDANQIAEYLNKRNQKT